MPLHLYRESRKREEAAKSSSSPALSPTVAIIYLVGTIYRGDGQFQSNAVTKAIIDAASNPKIDSIVLRIDSGGGDVVASDTIWNAVKRAQEKFGKPVVASYGNVSASGGYFISAGCRKIV